MPTTYKRRTNKRNMYKKKTIKRKMNNKRTNKRTNKRRSNKRKNMKGGETRYGTGVGSNCYDPNFSIFNTNLLKLAPYKPDLGK
jgi:hypothetical protein